MFAAIIHLKNFIMKKFLFFTFLAGLALFHAQAKNIPLKGDMPGTGTMSAPTALPVSAFQNANNVEISFAANLGDVIIAVVDDMGELIVFTPTKAKAGSKTNVDTTGWSNGGYNLYIIDEQGDWWLEGYFEI